MSAPWLTVVGLGEDGLDGLAPAVRALVDSAEVLVGGERHQALVGAHVAERLGWRFPLEPLMAELQARRGRRVVILATGDPMCFGIGSTLARYLAPEEMTVLPAPSAFALACARLGWPRHTVETLTLHGRPLALLNGWLMPDQRLLLLANDGETPAKVAAEVTARGFGPSRLVTLAHMGGPKEARFEATAESWREPRLPDLNTIALECRAGPEARPLPRLPGLPDEAYRHDGQLTKREVRAATLARLVPFPGQRLWDVGAGAGSIGIEWLRAARNTSAVAVERDPARAANIARNALALGTPGLEIVEGAAPAALAGLAPPDAVFVGGGLEFETVELCWQALGPGGRLVANAVTLEGEQCLAAAQARHGGDLVRIAVSRAAPVGKRTGWRPLMPVTQWAARKP
jgi:precorrin-6B C5,15-methyltransferase / cobalt-precorrin-6B C5,C15-methyltransferase